MGSMSIWHWLVVGAIVLLLFGRGRISEVMGDFGKGISSFKKGLNEGEKEQAEAKQLPKTPTIDGKPIESTTDEKTGA